MEIEVNITKGYTQASVDGASTDNFLKVAEILEGKLGITFIAKIQDLDSAYWDFAFKNSTLVLFYNVFEGASIFPKALQHATQSDNESVNELVELVLAHS